MILFLFDYTFYFAATPIGHHDNAIKCIEFCPEVNAVITGSWDQLIKVWDARSGNAEGSYTQPDKVKMLHILLSCIDKVHRQR